MRFYDFKVRLIIPSNVSKTEMRDFILDSIMANVGTRHVDDPIFELDRDSVSVVSITRRKLKALLEWHCDYCGSGRDDRRGHTTDCSRPPGYKRRMIEMRRS